MSALPEENPIYGPFFGVMGAASSIIFSGKCPPSSFRRTTLSIGRMTCVSFRRVFAPVARISLAFARNLPSGSRSGRPCEFYAAHGRVSPVKYTICPWAYRQYMSTHGIWFFRPLSPVLIRFLRTSYHRGSDFRCNF